MFRVTVACRGLSEAEGIVAVDDVLDEFTHRPWHQQVACTWRGGTLTLNATNDYDESGLALLDEFWDAVAACVSPAGSIRFEVTSVVAV